MVRPLRVDVRGGWYHVSARGIERRAIYFGDEYCRHFLELLEAMSERYGVEAHAYCLMPNHYHLIVRTPEANASRAIQWLNTSYAAWFNAKRNRVGHVFQGRFNSVLIDHDGAWLLLASEYLHLNPVRTKAMGLGKREAAAERRGYAEPSDQEIANRLEKLRKYSWSSYPAYAGYAAKPKWLRTEVILGRAGGRDRYREGVQSHLTGGSDPKAFECLRGRVALGTTAFKERIRACVGKTTGEQPDRKHVGSLVDFDRIVEVVERQKGEKWEAFRDRHGDDGRDLVLYLARLRSGLTHAEIGQRCGGMGYKSVQKASGRIGSKIVKNKRLGQVARRRLTQLSNVAT